MTSLSRQYLDILGDLSSPSLLSASNDAPSSAKRKRQLAEKNTKEVPRIENADTGNQETVGRRDEQTGPSLNFDHERKVSGFVSFHFFNFLFSLVFI